VKGIPARTSLSCYRVSKERCPVWPGDFPLCNFIVTLSNSVYPAILMNGWACLSFRHIIPRGVELRMATGIFTNRRNLTPGFRLLAQAFLLKHPHLSSSPILFFAPFSCIDIPFFIRLSSCHGFRDHFLRLRELRESGPLCHPITRPAFAIDQAPFTPTLLPSTTSSSLDSYVDTLCITRLTRTASNTIHIRSTQLIKIASA